MSRLHRVRQSLADAIDFFERGRPEAGLRRAHAALRHLEAEMAQTPISQSGSETGEDG